MMGWGWGMGGIGFGVLLLVAGAVVLVVWLARSGAGGAVGAESADRILKRRYAAGEIDREDYLRRLEDLHR